jgi:hypothetical protein
METRQFAIGWSRFFLGRGCSLGARSSDTLLHDNHGLDARDLRESVDRGEAARKLITLLHLITSLDVLQQLK